MSVHQIAPRGASPLQASGSSPLRASGASPSRASGSTSVMAARREPPDSLDFFPTPPWATRALLAHVIPDAGGHAWEPAAGEGHMAAVLAERFEEVWRTDVHDYSIGASDATTVGLHALGSFVGAGPDVVSCPDPRPDWIITNPPFNLAVDFAERALGDARRGVALLLRTAWMEGAERYERLFRATPPAIVAPFVERVPMVKGRWDPDASTATSYAWFVWDRANSFGPSVAHSAAGPAAWAGTRLSWIPPGCRQRLTHSDDRRRFAAPDAAAVHGLFDGETGGAA